jgi:hypothetical protein
MGLQLTIEQGRVLVCDEPRMQRQADRSQGKGETVFWSSALAIASLIKQEVLLEKRAACSDSDLLVGGSALSQGPGDIQACFDAGGASFQEVMMQRRKSL